MFFVIIKQDNNIIYDGLVQDISQALMAPLFEGETYQIEIFDETARIIQTTHATAKREGIKIKLLKQMPKPRPLDTTTISSYVSQLASRTGDYDDELKQKLVAISNMYPEKKYKTYSVRGGRLEHFIYLLLLKLKEQGVVDDVKWHGGLDQYGIPHPAPGRSKSSLGNPDILIHIDNTVIVLELTLIGKTRMQWSQEAESVPDHILGVKEEFSSKTVVGVFSAPDFYRPKHLKAVAAYPDYSITLKLCSLDRLVSILTQKSCTKGKFLSDIMNLP
jgi:hypothetical protein